MRLPSSGKVEVLDFRSGGGVFEVLLARRLSPGYSFDEPDVTSAAANDIERFTSLAFVSFGDCNSKASSSKVEFFLESVKSKKKSDFSVENSHSQDRT